MAIIRRDPNRAGLVLVSSSVDVASDGFVQINARFLLPDGSIPSFEPWSKWPQTTVSTSSKNPSIGLPRPSPNNGQTGVFLPSGTPANLQGGPFLLSKNIKKENGFVFADCVYVSAIYPIKPVINASMAVASFSAYEEDGKGNSQTITFDYYQVTRTYEYATVGKSQILYPPVAPGMKFNERTEGRNGLIDIAWRRSITGSNTETGPIIRWSITSTGTYYQNPLIVGGTGIGVEALNDYSNAEVSYG